MKHLHFSKRHRTLFVVLAGLVLAATGYYVLAALGCGLPCLFYRVTGLLCPGCGNTRAALALLRFDIAGAFRFNALWLPEFFYIGWVGFHCARRYLKTGLMQYKPPVLWLDLCILMAVVLWWPIRNL